MNLEPKLEVWGSPNLAGVVIYAMRCAKIVKARGIGGPILESSAYFMKLLPVQYTDSQARQMVEDFVAGEDSYAYTGDVVEDA